MNSRIFILENLPNLVMFRDVDGDDPAPTVKLRSINEDENEDFWLEEDISFQNRNTAKAFIKNYTEEQAKSWLEERIKEE